MAIRPAVWRFRAIPSAVAAILMMACSSTSSSNDTGNVRQNSVSPPASARMDVTGASSHDSVPIRFAGIPWGTRRVDTESLLAEAGYHKSATAARYHGSIYGYDAEIEPKYEKRVLVRAFVFLRTSGPETDALAKLVRNSISAKYGLPQIDLSDTSLYLQWSRSDAKGWVQLSELAKKDEPPYGVLLDYRSSLARKESFTNPF
jgi:hypothetical protein